MLFNYQNIPYINYQNIPHFPHDAGLVCSVVSLGYLVTDKSSNLSIEQGYFPAYGSDYDFR